MLRTGRLRNVKSGSVRQPANYRNPKHLNAQKERLSFWYFFFDAHKEKVYFRLKRFFYFCRSSDALLNTNPPGTIKIYKPRAVFLIV